MLLQKMEFSEPKLFLVYLGGSMEGTWIEMHDILFAVARTDLELAEKARNHWKGTQKSLHIDSWYVVEQVDMYSINLQKKPPTDTNKYLYFVNLGYYRKGIFGELHYMTLVIASSKVEAITLAQKKCMAGGEMVHSDNVYDLDDCIRIDVIDHYYIDIQRAPCSSKETPPINGYQKLPPSHLVSEDKTV